MYVSLIQILVSCSASALQTYTIMLLWKGELSSKQIWNLKVEKIFYIRVNNRNRWVAYSEQDIIKWQRTIGFMHIHDTPHNANNKHTSFSYNAMHIIFIYLWNAYIYDKPQYTEVVIICIWSLPARCLARQIKNNAYTYEHINQP